MSKTTKWVIAIIVIIIIGWFLYSQGIIPGTTTQSAAVVNNNAVNSVVNTTPGNTAKDQINRDVATLDTSLQASANSMANLGANPTQTQIAALANQFKMIVVLMTDLRPRLQTATVNSKVTTVKATIADLNAQISNASSQAAAVINNTAKISATATVSTSAPLKTALAQLSVSANYLAAARTDIGNIVGAIQ